MTHEHTGALVGVVDYGMGNLTSVTNALRALSIPNRLLSTPDELKSVTHVILPGVGAFGDAMRNLQQSGWIGSLTSAVIEERKPLLGICLGLQLLANSSEEFGEHKGLGWIDGRVVRMRPSLPGLRVPHIGWNDVTPVRDSILYRDVPPQTDFYFVHSYHLEVEDRTVCTGATDYGMLVTASIESANIFATQFHPEKSGRAGLKLLDNFVRFSSEST